MTSDQRFSLLLVVVAAALAALGWFTRRLIHNLDTANHERARVLDMLQSERVAMVERHYQRNMDAITDITKVVADNNRRLTDHYEGIIERLARVEGMFGEWLAR